MTGSVLVLAPHADDEVLSLGATIARFVRQGQAVRVACFFRHPVDREAEFMAASAVLGVTPVHLDFVDNEGEREFSRLVSVVEAQIRETAASTLLVPAPAFHQDHSALYHAALVCLRRSPAIPSPPEFVSAFEYPYSDSLPPGVSQLVPTAVQFVSVSDADVERKRAAWECYRSQHSIVRTWSAQITRLRHHGNAAGVRYAERLFPLKIVT